MSETGDFDEKHASDALGHLEFLDKAGVFDMEDPEDRKKALEASAFMAIVTDERPSTTPISDERIKRAGKIVKKLIPHDSGSEGE